MSFWHNYVKMASFWRDNDAIVASCVQWVFFVITPPWPWQWFYRLWRLALRAVWEKPWWKAVYLVCRGLHTHIWRNLCWYVHFCPLQWHHNGRDGVASHRRLDCLLHCLFKHKSNKHQRSASLAFVRGIHRASNAENNSIWWRHDALLCYIYICIYIYIYILGGGIIRIYLHILSFFNTEMAQVAEICPCERYGLFILYVHSQYHVCWYPGVAKSLLVNSSGIGQLLRQQNSHQRICQSLGNKLSIKLRSSYIVRMKSPSVLYFDAMFTEVCC